MKKLILLLALAASLTTAPAQSWTDMLKKAASDGATELLDKLTDGAATEAALTGTWNYKQPAVKLQSNDLLAGLGGSAIESTVVPKLQKGYAMAGIVEGAANFTFTDDEHFTAQFGKRSMSGSYTYDNATHSLTLTFDSTFKLGKVTGYAYLSGSELQLVFPITKLIELVKTLSQKISQLERVAKLIEQYDEIYLGFGFTKQATQTSTTDQPAA